MTVLLTRSEIESLIEIPAVTADLRAGFVAMSAAEESASADHPVPLRVRTSLPGPGTAAVLLPGLIETASPPTR